MKIPVFVSCPTTLSETQNRQRLTICNLLDSMDLEPRALGRSDYPSSSPLREVLIIAYHCCGGVILGFNQFTATAGSWKPGTKAERPANGNVRFPSPWNQLEAGILFSLRKPLLVFREQGVEGGIFDLGSTDIFIHPMPDHSTDAAALKQVFLKWRDKVGAVYYNVG
jgi:hypothetical protein